MLPNPADMPATRGPRTSRRHREQRPEVELQEHRVHRDHQDEQRGRVDRHDHARRCTRAPRATPRSPAAGCGAGPRRSLRGDSPPPVSSAPIAVIRPADSSDSPRSDNEQRRQPEVERGRDGEADELDAGAYPRDRVAEQLQASSIPTGCRGPAGFSLSAEEVDEGHGHAEQRESHERRAPAVADRREGSHQGQQDVPRDSADDDTPIAVALRSGETTRRRARGRARRSARERPPRRPGSRSRPNRYAACRN